ncbi:hypothetical protein AB4Y36_38005 [Paraburkholderia sp. BR10936]|uniref:phage baseplate plug family protein n=1 Tax=Paraburkholderia sp. BR10936 TaxID=3236993 RepID=UPI0034D210A3
MNIVPADATPAQQMTVHYGTDALELTIIWNSVGQHWRMDIFDVNTSEYIAQYVPLEVGIPIGQRYGREWIFMLADLSAALLDPVSIDDLGRRCVLMIGSMDEVREAAPVPLQ